MNGHYLRNKIRGGALASLITNGLLLPICVAVTIGVLTGASRFDAGEYMALAAAAICALVNVMNIIYDIKYRGDPTRHPSVRALLPLSGLSLDELSARFEAELNVADRRAIFGGVRVLPSWIYQQGTFRFTLIPVEDVAWVHKKVTTRRVNFVPVSKTYSVVLRTLRLPIQPFEFTAASNVVDAFLHTVADRVPWAIVGYNAGLEAQWRSNRAAVCAQIEQRKAQMVGKNRAPVGGAIAATAVSSPLA